MSDLSARALSSTKIPCKADVRLTLSLGDATPACLQFLLACNVICGNLPLSPLY